MITTTLNRIRANDPCIDGWKKLLTGLNKTEPDDESLPYAKILEINGIDDALWCCRAEPQHSKIWRLFAVWCAREVQHLMTDQRSRDAIDVAERYANDEATDDELMTAKNAARAARDAAKDAARDAASYAASDVASDAAWAARDAAKDAARAASYAASYAAWVAWAEQSAKFLEMVS